MMTEGRVLKQEDRIYDLVDPLDKVNGVPTAIRTGTERIYDLVDVVEKRPPKMALVDMGLRDEIAKRVGEVAEKIAREMVPEIAERVIREEIGKLRKAP